MKMRLMTVTALVGCLGVAGPVLADMNEGYVYDPQGAPVRDSQGECVKSPYRQSEAYPECEPQPKMVAKKETLTLEADAYFDFDKSVLKPEGKAKLDTIKQKLIDSKDYDVEQITVVGHTDSIGTEAYNQGLSERRADAVKAYVLELGASPGDVVTQGMGETQPVADNSTRDGRAKNRRVEVTVLAKEKEMMKK